MRFISKPIPCAILIFNVIIFLFNPGSHVLGDEVKKLKIFAKIDFVESEDHHSPIDTALPRVIRNAEELVSLSPIGRQAKNREKAQADPAIQKEVTELLMKKLKIEKIDWDKQMVIVARDGHARRVVPKMGFFLEVVEEKLKVRVGFGMGTYGAYGTAWAIALVERFDGQIEFLGIPDSEK